jgi:WD40 repeat protein
MPRPALLAFCGDEYLIAANDDGAATVWEMPSGRVSRSFTLPNMRDAVTSASPGGRYLAIAKGARGGSSGMMISSSTDGPNLSVYDIVSGQLAGEAKVPANGICVGLSFSPDGEEIGVLYRESRGSKLAVISVSDGSVSFECDMPRVSVPTATNSNGPMLQWFPNRERWLLFGQLILNRESAETTRLPTDKGMPATGLCRVLDDTHLLRVFGDKGKYSLKAVELTGGDKADE